MNRLFSTILILMFFSVSYGQVDLKNYQRAEEFIAANISKKYYRSWVKPNWDMNHKFLWYSINTKKGTEYIKYDLKSAKKKPLFNQ